MLLIMTVSFKFSLSGTGWSQVILPCWGDWVWHLPPRCSQAGESMSFWGWNLMRAHTHLVTLPSGISPEVSLSLQHLNTTLTTSAFCWWPSFAFHWLCLCLKISLMLPPLLPLSPLPILIPCPFFLWLTLCLPQTLPLLMQTKISTWLPTAALAPIPRGFSLLLPPLQHCHPYPVWPSDAIPASHSSAPSLPCILGYNLQPLLSY